MSMQLGEASSKVPNETKNARDRPDSAMTLSQPGVSVNVLQPAGEMRTHSNAVEVDLFC